MLAYALNHSCFGVLGPTAGPHTFNVNTTASATSAKQPTFAIPDKTDHTPMAGDLSLFGYQPTSVTRVLSTPCAADLTGQYVRHLLEPAFCSVPTAAEIPVLFQSALRISGTLPFPVPDVFYESHRRQDGDMKHYLAPVSQSAAVKFSSKLHDVLTKSFPAGTEMVQAGLLLAHMGLLVFCGLWCVQHPWTVFVFCHWFLLTHVACQHLCCQIHAKNT